VLSRIMLPRCRGIVTCCAAHSGGPFNVAMSGNCNGEAFGNPAENDRLICDDSNLMERAGNIFRVFAWCGEDGPAVLFIG